MCFVIFISVLKYFCIALICIKVLVILVLKLFFKFKIFFFKSNIYVLFNLSFISITESDF